jgi:hemerythrin superfamily protein
MNAAFERMSPSITSMIRMDHTHVTAAFHRFRADLPAWRKEALVRHACLALEVHAQLEEEIFYPALRAAMPGNDALEKSEPEHDRMKELIATLRQQSASDPTFDDNFFALMRTVIHHVADEESTLLPAAEKLLASQVRQLGAEMTRRRLQLLGPHAGEVASTAAQSFPVGAAAMAIGAVALGAMLFARSSGNGNRIDTGRRWR